MPPAYWSTDPVRIKARFWSKVEKTEDCWVWTGETDRDGYGKFTNGLSGSRKRWMAHRFSWTLAFGPIPNGLSVLHRCDNPPCLRPDHLFLGTQKVNAQDCVAKGRHSSKSELWALHHQANVPRNEQHGMVKLTDVEVAQIRASYIPGKRGCKAALARRFGISKTHVGRILAEASRKQVA